MKGWKHSCWSFELLKWLVAKVVSLRSPSSPVSVKALSDLNYSKRHHYKKDHSCFYRFI